MTVRVRLWKTCSVVTGGLAMLVQGSMPEASAQARPVNPQAAREATDAAAVTVSERDLEAGRTRPLTATGNVARSRNENYNIARASEGRLGIRLGNDVGVRITD